MDRATLLTEKNPFSPRTHAARWLLPVFAVVASFLLSGLFILLTDSSPVEGYRYLLAAGFGCRGPSQCALLTTLQFATPLILTGLSAAVALRMGIFSIGQAGQMLLGAAAAAWLSAPLNLPGWGHALLALGAGFLAGGIWGWIPGVLKVALGVNEVITSLLLNQLAFLMIGMFRMQRVPEGMRLGLLAAGTKLNSGIFVALAAAVFLYLYLWRHRSGYEGRMAGDAFAFTRFAGIRGRRAILIGMLLSGGSAGLAGAIEVLGVHYRFVSVFSGGGGFDGIAVALLGGAHPLGVPLAALLLAGLRLGATNGLQLKAQIPRELGGAMLAMMILLVSSREIYADLANHMQTWIRRSTSLLRGHRPPMPPRQTEGSSRDPG
jgi:simple sugar transport system permease protein